MLLKSVVCFVCFLVVEAKFYKTNVTDFNKCKIYYSRTGSIYQDFFEISDEPHVNGSLLDFHFSVLASSDAHILLAPSINVEKDDPVYEVVIGAGGNTFCDIRRMQKSLVKASIRVKGLLSALDIQSFWLHMSKEGIIEVGREGDELAFLTWTDPDPLPLKVFSFSTWPGVEAKWFFDCTREDNSTSNSKKIPRNMTSLEKLRKDLLFYYDPNVRPVKNLSSVTVVKMSFESKLVTLDEHKSIVEVDGKFYLQWHDEKLSWSSSNYSGIKNLHIFRPEIWVPNLHLFNSIGHGSNILEDSNLVVNSFGFVSWKAVAHLKSWCNPDDLGNWPRDVHSCDLILGFWKDFYNIQLVFDANNSIFNSFFTSEWKIIEVESISNKGWRNSSRDLSNFDPPALILSFKLKRSSTTYNTILFTPFYVVSISLLASFCVSPYGYLKMSLACSPLVFSTIMLIGLGLLIPVHSKFVPNLVLLYSNSLIATLICIIINIIVINLSRNDWQKRLPQVLTKILTSNPFKLICCLPSIKDCGDEYGNLNESCTKLNENNQSMWILLGVLIDRIAFLIYFLLTIYAFSVTY